jgi:hypothetical protein
MVHLPPLFILIAPLLSAAHALSSTEILMTDENVKIVGTEMPIIKKRATKNETKS